MCGICGIVDFSRPVEDGEERIAAMNASLTHRGPDDEGSLMLPEAALAMRRLSIIDVQGGHQPITGPGGATIIYNGETYNYRELRAWLEARGRTFTTNTDTEAVLGLYEERGADCLPMMNGMFAFAILDVAKKRLLLARDRLGIKPLYYHRNGTRLYFASEIKALLAHPDVPRKLNMRSLSRYLAHLYVPGDETIFEDIHSLPPGHFMVFDGGECEPECWWELKFRPREISEERAARELEELLRDAVKLNLVSDVTLGAFLSGGLDSSAVTAMMNLEAGGRVKTFSIGFTDESFDERRFARMVAEKYSTEHEEYVVDFPGIPDFLPKMARCFDQPFADAAAIPTYALAQCARRKVAVALSGNGGDELFGGYTKYLAEKYYGYMRLAPACAREQAKKTLDRLLPETSNLADKNRRIKRLLKYSLMPTKIRPLSWTVGFDPQSQTHLFKPGAAEEAALDEALAPWLLHYETCSSDDVLSRQQYTDIKVYLPDNNLLKDDIMGMANSLETRVPLLDHRVVEFAASLPPSYHINGFKMKYIFRKAIAKYLPPEIMERPKQGFTVPVGKWINGKLAGYADEMLSAESGPMSDYFDAAEIKKYLAEHRAGRADHGMRLWALIVFRAWHDSFF